MTAAELAAWDKAHFWHPFTPMQEWCAPEHEPLIIVSGEGSTLRDIHGRAYLDGNSTIWTNIHGHSHPALLAAIREQAEKIAHVSALGTTNEPAIRLARALTGLWPPDTLTRVFFTDDGSTAVECAMRMAVHYRQQTGEPERCGFAAFDHAYHGDTLGAASLGGVPIFQHRLRGLGLPVRTVRSVSELEGLPESESAALTAVVIEPLIQGAAGMRTWPPGMLRALRQWCDARGVLLIADEVMTGFGRTGKMFACGHEQVVPDFLCLAKGLTGGTMPLAATLTTERVFRAFLGRVEEQRTFYYGHSYTGHPLGCAAALANLDIFRRERTLDLLPPKIALMAELLAALQSAHPQHIAAVRQCGFIAGIDIVQASGQPYPWEQQTGARICHAARAHGLLTRPVRDTLVLMPPLCFTAEELRRAVAALEAAIRETLRRS